MQSKNNKFPEPSSCVKPGQSFATGGVVTDEMKAQTNVL